MYYMIIMLKFMEPEAEVKLVQNFYYKIYLVCNWEAGKEVYQPAAVYSLRLRRLQTILASPNCCLCFKCNQLYKRGRRVAYVSIGLGSMWALSRSG